MEKAIVINDLHIPFQDKKVLSLVEDCIEDFKPKHLFLNGDIADFWEISKFSKDPREGSTFREELRLVESELSILRDLAKEVTYVEGNHELRLRNYLERNAKELIGLKGLTIEEQLDLSGLKINYIRTKGKEAFVRYGDFLIGHFNQVNKFAGYTAKNLIEKWGMSLIQGHTHRVGMSVKTQTNGMLIGIENGCLCSLDPSYTNSPNWQHAFTILWKKGEKVYPEVVIIRDGKFTTQSLFF